MPPKTHLKSMVAFTS